MDNSRNQDTQGYKNNKKVNNIIGFPITNISKEDTFILGNTPISGIPTSDDYKVIDSLDTDYQINKVKKILFGDNPPEGIPTSDKFKPFESLDVEFFINQTKDQLYSTGNNEDIKFIPNRERIRKEIVENLKDPSTKKSLSSFFGFKK
jgi:hypothetical protein